MVKVTCLLALQICLPITRLLILLLRNHGFWIAEQPIILHLIHNFSHTLHHHLFQMLICSQAQLRSSHRREELNSMTISLSKCSLPSFNLNLMSVSKITSSLNCCVVFTPHGCVLQDLATRRMIGSGKQHAGLYYMSPLPNQTQHLLESFITFAQNQFQACIKTIRVDNELKFISTRNFFLKKGIECQRTCVYTPQQNGVVEHIHKHILNIARALIFQSHLPLEFWGMCFNRHIYH